MISKYLVSDLRGYLTLLKARYGEILTYPRRIVNSANRITLFCHITLAPIDTRKILGYSYGLKIINLTYCQFQAHLSHSTEAKIDSGTSTSSEPLRIYAYLNLSPISIIQFCSLLLISEQTLSFWLLLFVTLYKPLHHKSLLLIKIHQKNIYNKEAWIGSCREAIKYRLIEDQSQWYFGVQ